MEQHSVASARVAITGIGLATPLGLSVGENVARSLRGESAIGPMEAFGAGAHPRASAACVPKFDIAGHLRTPKNQKFMTPAVACAIRAGREAIEQSGIAIESVDPWRTAIYTGSGQTGVEYENYFAALSLAWEGDREMDFKYVGGPPSRLIDPHLLIRTLSNAGLALLACEFGIRGPNGNSVQGETASAHALDFAVHDLLDGRADLAIAGGYDSLLSTANFLAFQQAGLLSRSHPDEAYRPFDVKRDGLVLGAGAGFLVLERYGDAQARGAGILGEICGIGCAMDSRDVTGPSPYPRSLSEVVSQALDGNQIDFVVARGIGTQEDDRHEAQAIANLVGKSTPVTALKSQTGYLGAATVAAELGLGLCCARQNLVPPIARHAGADLDCPLDLVAAEPRQLRRDRPPLGLFLSYSWGGQITAIAARATCA